MNYQECLDLISQNNDWADFNDVLRNHELMITVISIMKEAAELYKVQ